MLFTFSPKTGFYLTKGLIDYIVENRNRQKLKITLDLGLQWNLAEIDEKTLVLRVKEIEVNLRTLIPHIKRKDVVYYFDPLSLKIHPVTISNANYYKLRYIEWFKAPTLEINGIHMHNIRNTDPWTDSMRKVSIIRPKRREHVLDICTGLGYTAIGSSLKAEKVITVEIDENVLHIAEYNPWSRKLSSEKIDIILGDAFYVIDDFADYGFDKVIHDPPRFALAGKLYSLEFYKKIYSVLKKGGLLFHYTGAPGKYRGLNIQKGVINRLRLSGFRIIHTYKDYGVLAKKI